MYFILQNSRSLKEAFDLPHGIMRYSEGWISLHIPVRQLMYALNPHY